MKSGKLGSVMKLNFWQILGLVLVVVALVYIIYDRMKPAPAPSPASTQTSMLPRQACASV